MNQTISIERSERRIEFTTYPLEGFVQVRVSGSPALAWIPFEPLSMTLLPCAAAKAAKARTIGAQGRMMITIF